MHWCNVADLMGATRVAGAQNLDDVWAFKSMSAVRDCEISLGQDLPFATVATTQVPMARSIIVTKGEGANPELYKGLFFILPATDSG